MEEEDQGRQGYSEIPQKIESPQDISPRGFFMLIYRSRLFPQLFEFS